MTSLFISYSRKDTKIARKLTDAFKGQGLDFWIDWEGIPPTVEWWREIERGIEKADIFLFLLSPDSAKSKICRKEIKHAVRNGKRLIPVVVRDVTTNESPNELRKLNWIFLRETDKFGKSFRTLMTAIQSDYAWAQTHSQLQVKALEWHRSNKENSFLLQAKELLDAEMELVSNSSKEPFPTELQREYVLLSRQASDRQRRDRTRITTIVAIVLAGLAIFGFLQARLATANAQEAQTASTLAFNNASTAEANANSASTAQAIAETERQIAVEERNIAYARQLHVDANQLIEFDGGYDSFAIFLAIESMRLYPSNEAASILNDNIESKTLNHDSDVSSISFNKSGSRLVTGSGNDVRVWNTDTGVEITHTGHSADTVAFSSDDNFVVSGGADNTVRIWDANNGNEMSSYQHDDPVMHVAFSLDGKCVIASSGHKVHVWNITTGEEKFHIAHDDLVSNFVIASQGNIAASESVDHTIMVWEILSGDIIVKLIGQAVAISQDGKLLAYVDPQNNTIQVIDIRTNIVISKINHSDSLVFSLAFNPDGQYLVSGGSDNTARVWEILTAKEISSVMHEMNVFAVVFSPNGKYVTSRSGDNIRVWDALTGRELTRYMNDGLVAAVVFSPDSQDISIAHYNTVQVRSVDQLAYACSSLPRNFNPQSWDLLLGNLMTLQEVCPNFPIQPINTSKP